MLGLDICSCMDMSVKLICFFPPTEIPVDKLSNMPALKWLNIKSNPLDSNTQSALQSPHNFELLSTTES